MFIAADFSLYGQNFANLKSVAGYFQKPCSHPVASSLCCIHKGFRPVMDTTFSSLHFSTKSCVSGNFQFFLTKAEEELCSWKPLQACSCSRRFLMENEDLKFSTAICEQRWKVKANQSKHQAVELLHQPLSLVPGQGSKRWQEGLSRVEIQCYSNCSCPADASWLPVPLVSVTVVRPPPQTLNLLLKALIRNV